MTNAIAATEQEAAPAVPARKGRAKTATEPVPAKPQPCEVVATWQDWLDATKRARLTGRRHILPVLAAAYLCLDEHGTVCMRATDLENSIETKMPGAYMEGPGPLLVKAASLLAALQGIKGALTAAKASCERIRVTRTESGDIAVSGFGRTLRLLDAGISDEQAEGFPWPKAIEGEPVLHLPAGSLSQGFGFARTAAGKDDTLPMLTGVKLDVEEGTGTARFIATDRYRLAIIEVPAIMFSPLQVLVPDKAWPMLKVLRGGVLVRADDSRLQFADGDVTVDVRLLDSTFPPYRSLLPSSGTTWTLDRLQLIGDISAAAAVVEDNAPVRIELGADKYQVEGCEIHAVPSTEDVDGVWVTAFNPLYLLDGLKAFTGAEITLLGTSPTKPFVLTGTVGVQEGTYMQMPVRLPG